MSWSLHRSRPSTIQWPDRRSEPTANLVWCLIRRLSAFFLKKALGRIGCKCMMCAIASGVVAECETKNNMYKLIDSFNDVVISRHRTLKAAQRAMEKHLRAVRRHNGPNSYLTYEITYWNGAIVSLEAVSL